MRANTPVSILHTSSNADTKDFQQCHSLSGSWNVMEVLEEEITCPICCNLFEDPRVLPCSHNFCQKCLEGILLGISRQLSWRPSSFKCPTCRKDTSTQGANSHQVNYALKGIVEKYNKIKAAPKMPLCKEHSGQPLNMFCTTDQKLICGFCATSVQHKDHVFMSTEDAYHQKKHSLGSLLQEVENLQSMEVYTHLDALETRKKQALQLLNRNSAGVKDYFEKLQCLLEQKKNETLSDLETMKLSVMQMYDPAINKTNTIKGEQEKIKSITEGLKDISDPLVFLQRIEELRGKINLLKSPLPSLSDETIIPDMESFNTTIWDQIKLGELDKLCLPQQPPAKISRLQLKFPFSTKLVVIAIIPVLLLIAFMSAPNNSFIQAFDSPLQTMYPYLLDTNSRAVEEAAFYWDLTAQKFVYLVEVLKNYITIFMENVAKIACQYTL
ncbi:E3 ubiquitin-protein ligase TRIM13 [Pseudophryne corroboree]|uniref:E3 ubiquitin-protein ligase TRIM13 n=1 Tax=Pseudophryne corroboree TaxID=495146 RepID=UPI00308155B5